MDPRIQVKLDKYQKCGNIISQTSLLSSYTGSETDADDRPMSVRFSGPCKGIVTRHCMLLTTIARVHIHFGAKMTI